MISFLKNKVNKIILSMILFFILALFTRFSNLSYPNEIVFDEYHFFHFITEYEQGEYFFDIHPPLGKLILLFNAQFYGLDDFANKISSEKSLELALEKEKNDIKDSFLLDESLTSEEIKEMKKRNKEIKNQLQSIKDSPLDAYSIGKEYDESLNIFGLRSVPALFGALLVPLMIFFAYILTSSVLLSSLVGVLVLFSPSFLVESQYIMMDSILMFFIVSSALVSFLYYRTQETKWLLLMSLFSAISVSIKWTGLSVVALNGLVWIFVFFQNKAYKKMLLHLIYYWFILPVFYILTFYIHFLLLPFSGSGDAFHTPEFKKNLLNSKEYNDETIIKKTFFFNESGTSWFLQKKDNPFYDINNPDKEPKEIFDWENWKFYGKFLELNRQMGDRSAAIKDSHPFSSTPLDWIKGDKSIYLWNKDNTNESFLTSFWTILFSGSTNNLQCKESYEQQLYLFTNKYLWKLIFVSTLILLLLLFATFAINRFIDMKGLSIEKYKIEEWFFIVFIILLNILPFVFIDRPKFLYHSFEYILFAMLGFVYLLSIIFPKYNDFRLKILSVFLIVFSLIIFIISLPLIYGFSFDICIRENLLQIV